MRTTASSAVQLFAAAALAVLVLPSGCNATTSSTDDVVAPPPGLADANCTGDGSDADYAETLTGSGETMVRQASTETGCPNYIFLSIPNRADLNFYAGVIATDQAIPAFPMLQADGGTRDLSNKPDAIGILRNGVAMFSPWAGFRTVDYDTTGLVLEQGSIDVCGGHSTRFGAYHHHNTPGCLQKQAGAEVGQHSPLLGWSFDGFPTYGQLGPEGIEMKGCGLDGADSTYCLDGCMGYEGEIDEDDFTYRYYSSCGFDESFYPMSANCYRGCCPDGIECNSLLRACEDGAEEGYTADYVPTTSTPLTELFSVVDEYNELFDPDVESSTLDLSGVDDFTVQCSLFLGSGPDFAEVADEIGSDNIDAEDVAADDSGAPGTHSFRTTMLSSAAAAASAATAVFFSFY